MKKILMRAGMAPLENLDPFQVLVKNTIGNNIGNMLFPYSIARTLLTRDTQMKTIIPERVTEKTQIARLNETYDCFVMPFANAFRVSFIRQLKGTTNLIKQLKMPCIVTGIGLQQGLGEQKSNLELDDAVVAFMKAVLDKSSMVGVRGESTGAYLKKLGFREEKEFTVIGCPSMYLHGKKLPEIKPPVLRPDMKLSLNSKICLPQKFHDFMYGISRQYPNYQYVPQVIEEIFRMYTGMPYPEKFVREIPRYFPMKFSNPIYKKKKGLSFVNVPTWLSYMKEKDLSIGSRIHGNIAAILAGTPAFIVVSDQRILELASYHHIPHITMEQLQPDTSLEEIMEQVDYAQLQEGHTERFMHYLWFLRENGLETIYDSEGNSTDVPFDEMRKKITFEGPLYAFSTLNSTEQAKRLEQFLGYYRNRVKKLEKQAKESNGKFAFL